MSRTLSLLTIAVAAATAGPTSAANAAEVHGAPNGDIVYTAGPGEDNQLSTHEEPGFVHFLETGAAITPGQFCETVGLQVRCLASGLGVVRIALGDGDNWASNG